VLDCARSKHLFSEGNRRSTLLTNFTALGRISVELKKKAAAVLQNCNSEPSNLSRRTKWPETTKRTTLS
jgi:hypothetical protein